MHLDLVQPVLPPYLNRCFVRSFVNIFVDIFYGFDCDVDLDINIGIVLTDEIWVVRDNKTVIKTGLLSTDGADHKLAVITAAVDWVTVIRHLDLVCKRLWKAFHAL